MWSDQTRQLIAAACAEDLGATGDVTSRLLPNAHRPVAARVVAREAGVVCGLALAPLICEIFARRVGAGLEFTCEAGASGPFHDGQAVAGGTHVAAVRGPRAAVLALERTLLNFLGRLSGIATLTSRYVVAARAVNAGVRILDTRKTLPGWRELDKYAVRCGGGHNHRFGLYDAVLIKDNHLAHVPVAQLADALRDMLARLPAAPRPPDFVEVEVDRLEQLAQVCEVDGVDVALLDNFTPDQLRAAVQLRDARGRRGRLALEASGGVTLANVADIAAAGVERISVGALTHSAPALDIALDV